MKAVIMAGGEGTRLRPLTSNAPKPMLPLANRPMMEHIVDLLKRHGFDEIVVTVAFLANAIRTYFGDGSEFGVGWSTPPRRQPLGTAGSVRNAMDELDERFLVISGDVLTDIDLGQIVEFHDEHKALATIGLVARREPARVRHRHHPRGRLDRALPREADLGPGVQRHHQHRHLRARARDLRLHRGRPAGRLLERGVPRAARRRDAAVRRGRRGLLGGRRHARGLREGPQGRARRQGRSVDIPGFELDATACGWGRAPRSTPTPTSTGPAVDRRQLPDRGRRPPRRVHACSAPTCGCGASADLERAVVHDNAYLGEACACGARSSAGPATCATACACEEGVVLGDECFVGEDAVLGAGVKVYPFKTVEAGAIVNSSIVWESRGARSLFGRDGVAGLANVDITPELATTGRHGLRHHAQEGHDASSRRATRAASARMLKRAMMAGLNARASTCSTSRWRRCRSPGSWSVARRRRRRSRCGSLPATRSRWSSASSTPTASTSPRTPSARSSGCSTGRTSAGCSPARSATSASRPGRSSTTPPRSRAPSTSSASASARFKVVVDYAYGSTSFVMPNVLAKLGADVLAVNPYASTAGVMGFDRTTHAEQVAGLVRASGAHLGAVIDPDGEHLTLIDDEGHVLTDTEALLALLTCCRRPARSATASPCRCRPRRRAAELLAAPRASASSGRSCRRRR